MGIPRSYRHLRDDPKYSKFFTDPKKPQFPPTAAFKGKKVVIVEDLLTRMHWIQGPRKDFRLTGKELYDYILRDVVDILVKGWCQTYVLVVDAPALKGSFYKLRHVQKKKEKDQEAEDKEKYEPYPHDYDFCDAGIGNSQHTEQIDTRRLMDRCNEFMRERLWSALARYMATFKFPQNATVVFDYREKGPLVVSDKFVVPEFEPYERAEYEADTQSWLWALRYHEHPIWMRSTDSDFILYGCAFLLSMSDKREAKERRSAPVYWVDKFGLTYCKLTALYEFITSADGMGMRAFAMACFLCGNDFLDHMWFTNRLAPDKVFMALEAIEREDDGWELLDQAIEKPEYLYKVVKRCYGQPESLPVYAPLQNESFALKFEMFRWAWGYAFRLWADISNIPPDYTEFHKQCNTQKRPLLAEQTQDSLSKRSKKEETETEPEPEEDSLQANLTVLDTFMMD
jgi:hypothetical protein